ncbi:hypothetical protein ACI2JA_09205 [Alkalihalobacillus sp. NPDC078783]
MNRAAFLLLVLEFLGYVPVLLDSTLKVLGVGGFVLGLKVTGLVQGAFFLLSAPVS